MVEGVPRNIHHLWPLVWGLSLGASVTWGSSVSPVFQRTITEPAAEGWTNVTETTTGNHTGPICISLLPPRWGFFYVEVGTGLSLGSVLAFWCQEGFQLVGSEKITCVLQDGVAQWSNYLPVCEALPRPEDRGLRVAILVSVVSSIIILTMSTSFIICCLQEHLSRRREQRLDSRFRKRKVRKRPSSQHSDCWLECEDGDWDAFPPPKLFHLAYRPQSDKPPREGELSGFENRGYQRSQESLLKVVMSGLYPTDGHVHPPMVLQRVPTPVAPVYLHLSVKTSDATQCDSTRDTPGGPTL